MATDLEKRITELEDIESIKKLKALYCDVCDDDHNPDRIWKLFAEDGIWEGAGFGKAQGHQAIRDLFAGFKQLISFSQHNIFNPQIVINGDRAHASWYLVGPFTFREKGDARWLACRYEDDYVKINGEWKYQHLRAFVRVNAPYETGWAQKA